MALYLLVTRNFYINLNKNLILDWAVFTFFYFTQSLRKNTMGKKGLIIFDMDGTLINSGNVISNTINYVRTNIGLEAMPKEELLVNINNPDINSAEFFYGTTAFTQEQTKLFSEYYEKHCISDIILYDGILDMLDDINKHFTLSIATNASVEFANKMLEYLNINHYFDMVVGANCVKKPKPHPEMLLHTLDKLSYKADNTILIGDSLKDKRAATEANMDCILVNWGFTVHSKDKDVVNNTKELNYKLINLK
jgi:phosphoglycolate phosphatase